MPVGMDAVTLRVGQREPIEGAQSIKRAVDVLRTLGSGGGPRSVAEVSAATGLHRATAHRILRALFDEGMVEQDADSRRYRLGLEIFAMSAALGARRDLKSVAQPSLERLCRETEDTIYLTIRSGYDGLCLSMLEGSYPERTLKLSAGDRWPLGVGASNMPLLAFLPESEAAAIIAHNAPRLADYPEYSTEQLQQQAAECRQRGYAVKTSHWYPTMCGVGVAVMDHRNHPIAALSVTAVLSRMPAERQEQLAAMIRVEAEKIAVDWEEARTGMPVRESWRLERDLEKQPTDAAQGAQLRDAGPRETGRRPVSKPTTGRPVRETGNHATKATSKA